MARLATRLSAIIIASAFFLLAVAVSQASGARVLGGAHSHGAAFAVSGPGLGGNAPVVVGNKNRGSISAEDCGGEGNNKYRNVLLLDGFLPKGTNVSPSGPSKRSNSINN
ncbi:hypothetical protein CDL15_Pgr007679 [Punica granatum]|uniref:Uncharacterized protein n=1 Tax=Punica granatum TaxID=22663 RepID=A0A218XAW4_PUNGR|nr:hypothetical protein CDL15_Pgr007679 [Punica granatum]PKI62928.1 hypothetical protein CRG98_016687 [Punica granatum]